MPKLRLLKVLVQPILVLDHGDYIEEVEHPTIAVPAAQWPAYSGERFPQELAEWQGQLNDTEDPRQSPRA